MRHLRHHAADGVRVRTLNHLIQPGESQTLDHQLLFHRGTNRGTHPLQVNLPAARTRFLRRHLVNLESETSKIRTCLSTEYRVLSTVLTAPAPSSRASRPLPRGSSTASARRR